MAYTRAMGASRAAAIVGAVLLLLLLPLLIFACAPAPPMSGAGEVRPFASPILARPPLLRVGQVLRPEALEDWLARADYRQVEAPRRRGEWAREGRRYTVIGRAFLHADGREPGAELRVTLDARARVRALERAGSPVAALRLEPERLGWLDPRHARWQRPVELDEVPPILLDALIEIEDRRFRRHAGIDPLRIAGAALANWRAGRVVQGGSTITQQLAKNLYLTPERTLSRKLREASLALRLERAHSKDALLEAYVNEIYMGHADGLPIHGLAAAARHHVGRLLGSLELADAALLVGMIRAPNRYAPGRDPGAARTRRDDVLDVLEARGVIDAAAANAARAAAVPVPARQVATRGRHYLDAVRAAVHERIGKRRAAAGGLVVHTTIDARLQRAAERAVHDGLEALRRDRPVLADVPLEAALVALDPGTGEVLAHVGGADYLRSQFDRVRLARRQPGSAFKPVVALAALAPEGGAPPRFTLVSRLDDEPFETESLEGPWVPRNHDKAFRGEVSVREAIEQSLNVPVARLGSAVGARRIVEVARRLGIESPLPAVPSLALGVADLTPLELARAYATLAAGGIRTEPHWLHALTDHEGTALERVEPERQAVVDPAAAWLVTSALRGAVDRGTARRLRQLGVQAPVAAKTGSTNGYRDGWLVGYTPEVVAAVWVGRDRDGGIHAPGAVAALPIFAGFLRGAGLAGREGPEFEPPESVSEVAVHGPSGLLAGWRCEGSPEWFIQGTAPRERCGPFRSRRRGRSLPDVAAGGGWRDTCYVRLERLESLHVHSKAASYVHSVRGRAGQTGRVWLSAPLDERRHVAGPAVRVEDGPFRAELQIELDTPARTLTAVLELDGGKRCRDRDRVR